MLTSVKHLPRDLKIVGGVTLLFAAFQIGGISRAKIYLVQFIVYLSSAIVLFSLSTGVAKKEKWAWNTGVVTFGLAIIGGIISILLKWTSPIYLVTSLLIPGLFLITFLKNKSKLMASRNLSSTPFALWLIGFLTYLGASGYLFYLVKIKRVIWI